MRAKDVYKKIERILGWIFEDVPKWILYLIVFIISFVIFWFWGYLMLVKVFAIVVWILLIILWIASTLTKIETGQEGAILKLFTKSFRKKKKTAKEIGEEDAISIEEALNREDATVVGDADQKQDSSTEPVKDEMITNSKSKKASPDDNLPVE